MRSLQSLFDLYPNTHHVGLNAAEAADSRSRFGVNKLTPLPREPIWKKFLAKFDEPIIRILLAASLLKIVVDLFEAMPIAGASGLIAVVIAIVACYVLDLRDWLPSVLFALAGALVGVGLAIGSPSFEGLAVMLAVALATGVAFLSEYRSDREFEKLDAQKDAIRVKILRDGNIHAAPLEEVLVGDLIILEGGDEIPADGRITQANELLVDQSLMTGESEPSTKLISSVMEESDSPDQAGCVYRGTQVVGGLGRMIVTNVGDDTMLGQIARRLSSDATTADEAVDRVQKKLTISKQQTPLQQKLIVLAGQISRVGYIAAVLIFLALFVRGMFFASPREVFWPTAHADVLTVTRNLLSYFVYMVIVIVVAVPEGLPMSVTVSLALAMRKMTRANALVRQLVATETIGSATVICTDKTGTLTQNKMTVVRLGIGDTVIERTMPGFAPRSTDMTDAVGWIAANAALNSTAYLEEREGQTRVIGSSTEGALLHWLRNAKLEPAMLRLESQPLFRIAFSSAHKTMTTVVERGRDLVVLSKGAPEVILSRCSHYMSADGSTQPLTAEVLEAVAAHLAAASNQAMRTLGFAHVVLPPDFPRDAELIASRRDWLEQNLVFSGFAAIQDPVRDDVAAAVAECHGAGIMVMMITGDTIETARAIAREIGLLDAPNKLALTSADFEKLTDEEMAPLLPHLRVLARAKPLDKYRLVRLLQDQGHVVAMTGDGTNDAPSLRKADVGLAMGIAGTEVAKEASQIVLLDDSFGTIVKAVHWGRALYENIQRFIQFQLTINVSALLIAFLGPFFGIKPPFTVLQLLWINVIMDTFAAIALCSEPPRPGLMRQPPKRRTDSIVTRTMMWSILLTSAFSVVVRMGLLMGMVGNSWFASDSERSSVFPEITVRQVAIFFTVYVMFQIWNQINCRSLTPTVSALRGLFQNRLFLIISTITLIGQIVIVQFGGDIFAVEPLSWLDWLVIGIATSSVLIFAEASRFFRA